MHALSKAPRLTRLLKPPILLSSEAAADQKLLSSDSLIPVSNLTSPQWQTPKTFSSSTLHLSGIIRGNYLRLGGQKMTSSKALFSTEAGSSETTPTEAVKELYGKILESVNTKRTMAPNAWLWSLIENCKNQEDIRLLFDTLQNLRRFRLSNLRIHNNFNRHLCHEVARACARVGALDFGKKTLRSHNLYGLSPSVGSANHLLSYAKDHNDVKLMAKVMKLLKTNKVPLQSGTADLVFSICYNSNNWTLISEYSKWFIEAGVKLRKTAFGIWMDFAAKRGNTESLWEIEKLRSKSMKQHTIVSGFSCAKGLILEHKPEEAAAVIQVLNQILPENKKSRVTAELQKLVNEWPLDVVNHQEEEDKKAVAAALSSEITAMINSLRNIGLEMQVNLEDANRKEEFLS